MNSFSASPIAVEVYLSRPCPPGVPMSSLAISASARGMAANSSSSQNVRKTTKTYVYKTDSDGKVTTHTDVQVSGSAMSESGEAAREGTVK